MERIFDVSETLAMWDAVQALRSIRYEGSTLGRILDTVTTLDDPYYMRLSPETYGSLVRRGAERAL